jgi:glycosyltransferase involved in cell wall biosynthesis
MQLRDGIEPAATEKQPAFIIWIAYQRRSEVLSALLGCVETVCFPHYFRRSLLRPLDYVIKFFRTIFYLRRSRPSYVILQAPPVFAALAAIVAGIPYIVDVHNGLVQSFWSKVPLTQLCLNRAVALIAHNSEIASALSNRVPAAKIVVIQDPIQEIRTEGRTRAEGSILFICSFDRDEPVELILEIIRALPEYRFTITANPDRLSPALRRAYQQCPNLLLSGFLSTADYHALLTSSQAAVVLSTMPSIQPSGGVEALSSDTPLVVTRTTLTDKLFGDWANLCDNNLDSIVMAIRSVTKERLNLQTYRTRWNADVARGIAALKRLLDLHTPNRSYPMLQGSGWSSSEEISCGESEPAQ